MKSFLLGVAALGLASTAGAEERLWQFHPGQTFTWECESKFTYSVDKNKVGGRGETTAKGNEKGGGDEGGGMTC